MLKGGTSVFNFLRGTLDRALGPGGDSHMKGAGMLMSLLGERGWWSKFLILVSFSKNIYLCHGIMTYNGLFYLDQIYLYKSFVEKSLPL